MPASRRVPLVAGLLLLAFVVAVGWLAWQGLQARDNLRAAGSQAQQLRDALASGDAASARSMLGDLQDSSDAAVDNTDGPLWALAGVLPAVGDDVRAVRSVSVAVDRLADDALPPLVEVAETVGVETFSPRGGRIPIAPLERLGQATGPALAAVESAYDDVAGIDPSGLVGPLRDPVTELQGQLADASDTLGAADTALTVLPSMLGKEERRDYLVLFQNNAEIRAAGGIPGAFAVISASDGRLSLERQGSAATIGSFEDPVLPLTDGEQEIYTEVLGRYLQNVTMTPDFPRSGELASEMWQRQSGRQVDGVLSVDPVALSYLLEATGPVTLDDGSTLTAGNAVERLLNETYLRFADSPVLQDAFFASAAARVFEALTSGQGDPQELIKALARGVEERRLLVWSTEPSEQEVLAPTAVSGVLPTGEAEAPQVGVYLNDATGAKMQYYLDYDVDVLSASCADDGVQTFRATVTLRSTAPDDAARSLPESVIGPGLGAAPPGSMWMQLVVYAPTSGGVENVRFDGEEVNVLAATHDGRPVMNTFVALEPGQEVEVTMDIVSGAGQPSSALVDVTPGVQQGDYAFEVESSCA